MIPRESESPHLNDQQLIGSLYCEENQTHLDDCAACRDRLRALAHNRQLLEAHALPDPEVSFEALAIRRRQIYERLSRPLPVWERLAIPRWISAGATVIALAGGLMIYQHRQTPAAIDDRISDAQLAQEVSSLSQTPEASPTGPLEELFE